MTVSSSVRKAGPYSGTGSTGPFSFSFKVFQASDLLVVKVNNSTNVETTLTLTTDYTVSLNADQNANPGGTITLVAALAVGYNMVISSQVPYLQETDLTNQGGFYPEVITDALDKLTIEAQQLNEQIDRAIKLPITSTEDVAALTADLIRVADSADNVDTVANNIDDVNTVATNIADVNTVNDHIANVDTVATHIANVDTVATNIADVNTVADNMAAVNNTSDNMAAVIDAPNQAAAAEQAKDDTLEALAQAQDGYKQRFVPGTDFTAGVTTTLTLAHLPAKSNTVTVYIGGVYQETNAWSLVGQVLTFTSALPNSAVEVHYFVPSEYVGLTASDQQILGQAQASAQASATTATTQANIATNQTVLATSAKAAAEAARDAAIIQSGVYVDEPTGRAAVADGVAFKVQGSGSVAAYEYRRVNSGSSTLIATYPSKAAYDAVAEKQKLKADVELGKNLFNPNDADIVAGYYVEQSSGTLFSNANYSASAFIPVIAGTSYSRSSLGAGVLWQFAWFNSNKGYISGGTAATATAPAGAAYLRTSVLTSQIGQFQVEAGSSVTPFVAYTPTIPPAQLRNGSVSELKHSLKAIGYRHTQFIQTGKNLFNSADPDVALGYYVDGSTGNLTVLAGYNTTGYIPVTGGAAYAFSYINQLAWYDASKNYISGVTGGGGVSGTRTAPANAVYVRVMAPLVAWASLQVEAGTTSTWYEAFKLSLSGPGSVPILAAPLDASVTPTKTTFIDVGKNKFNKATVTTGYYMGADGYLDANAPYDLSDYIAVTAGTTYYCTGGFRFTTCFDANKILMAGGASSAGNSFTVPAGCAYLRITINHSLLNTTQFEVGTTGSAYESYGYVLKDKINSYPIRYEANTASDYLTVAAKQYIPYGKELAIYHENITKDYKTYCGKTGITFTGGKETGPSTKITPTAGQVGTTISATATLADTGYELLTTKAFSIIVADPTKTTTANIQNIGDSYTGRMTWANVINATAAATGLTFSGNRTSGAATPAVRCEGQGGWTISSYFSADAQGGSGGFFSPFMQPVNSGYLFYGPTSCWIDANSASPSYNASNFIGTKDLFSSTTGRKLSPNVNDIMGEAGGFIRWDGSAWVSIASSAFGGLAFNYAKYRQAWSIPAPTILHVLLGTNDFAGSNESTFAVYYPGYKANYDALIASVKADTPGVKIVVGIPVSSGRQGKWGTFETERRKRAYYLLAKNLNADYGGREAENIYVLDYHSIVDRFYGYDNAYEKPFGDYSGATGDDLYKSDTVHLGADGFKQMGNAYMGMIQYLR